MSEYNNLFVKLDGELALLHDSARLPTPWMARLYMNNLSSAFDTFKAHWVQSHDYVSADGKFTSLDELMEAVKKEEQRMYTESRTTTLFSQGRKGNDETASKCLFCKKLYHTEAKCVAKHLYLKPALEKRLKKKRANREKKRNEQKRKDSVLSTEYSLNQEESPI